MHGSEDTSESGTDVRRFGDYELFEEIARGGMGVIYRARQRSLDRPVAVKMVHSEGLRSPSGRMRFQVEAEAIARLDHPHIVSLFEFGEREGQLFYSMQYVACGTFHDELGRGHRSLREKIALLVKVARAVAYAHSKGVLHRDLKPSNILIDEKGEPLLADFGLAKFEGTDLELTRSESVLGSPNYMAPEQAQSSELGSASTAADTYSLGAILYEVLCGVPPFRAETVLETMRRLVDEEARFPSQEHLLDPDLCVVCLKCLEKLPQRRYRSAASLADDLERWMNGQALHARPLGRFERLDRWVRREPALAGALLGVGLLLLSVAAVSTSAYYRIKENSEHLQAATDRTAEQLYLSELREVDDFFEKGQTSDAMALMAKLGRDWPKDFRLLRRMENILNYQSIPILASPMIKLSEGRILAWATFGDSMAQAVLESGSVVQLNQLTGNIARHCYRAERPVSLASLARTSLDVALVYEDGAVQVLDVEGRVRGLSLAPGPNVTHIALSPDGRRVGIVTDWRYLNLWSTDSGEVIGPESYLPKSAASIEFSPDGSLLSLGMSSGGGLLFVAETGAIATHFEEESQSYHDVDFSQDNRVVAYASPGGAVALWDRIKETRIDDGTHGVQARMNGIRVAPDGSSAVFYDSSGKAKLLDLATGSISHEFSHFDYISHAAYSTDGINLLTGSHDRTARVWEVSSGRSLSYPLAHTSGIQFLAFGEGPRDVRVVCYDGTFWKWHVGGAFLEPVRSDSGQRCLRAAYDSRNDVIALGVKSLAGPWMIRLVRPQTAEVIREWKVHDIVEELMFDETGALLACHVGSEVSLRKTETGALEGEAISFQYGGIGELALNSEGTQLAVASRWEPPRIVNVSAPSQPEFHLDDEVTEAICYSPDGTLIATANAQGRCRVWEAATGKQLAVIAENGTVPGFSPDGRYVGVISSERAYLVSRKTMHWIPGEIRHDSQIKSLTFSPDSNWVATASMDETVQVWRLRSDQLQFVTQLWHHAAVNAVEFAPDGDWLISGSDDGNLRLWDAETGFPLSEWLPHDGAIRALFVDDEGKWFSSVTERGTISTWPYRPGPDLSQAILSDLLEYLGRHQVNAMGRAVSLNLQEMLERERRLHQALESNPSSAILKRFLSQGEPRISQHE